MFNKATQVEIINNKSSLLASVCIGLTAVIFFLTLPLFIGAISDAQTYDPGELTWLSSADLLGFFLGSLTSVFYIRRVNWRYLSVVLILLLLLDNAICIYFSPSFLWIVLLRILNGLLQGTMISIFSAHVSDRVKAERGFAIFVAAQTIIAAICLAFLPTFIARTNGPSPIFLVQSVIAIIALVISIMYLPAKGLPRNSIAKVMNLRQYILPVIGILGWLLFYLAQGGTWAFMERVGSWLNYSPSFIGLALSLSMGGSFVGSLLAGLFGEKLGRNRAFLIVIILQPLCLLLLFSNLGALSFYLGAILFSFFWSFCIPFLMGVLIDVDQSGKAVLLANPIFSLGVSIAPSLIAIFVSDSNYWPVFYLYLIAILASIVLFLFVNRQLPQKAG